MPRTLQIATPVALRQELRRYERAHGLPSEEFLRRWNAGTLEERMDYFRWVNLCTLAAKMGLLAAPGTSPAPDAPGERSVKPGAYAASR